MPLSAAVGRRYKHVGNASLDDERESKATFSLRFNTQELSSGTYSIRCLLPKDYFETSTSSMKETSSADQTEDRDAMKKKKEVHTKKTEVRLKLEDETVVTLIKSSSDENNPQYPETSSLKYFNFVD